MLRALHVSSKYPLGLRKVRSALRQNDDGRYRRSSPFVYNSLLSKKMRVLANVCPEE